MIYLNNAATSWPKPESVYLAVNDYMRNVGVSAGRSGGLGIKAGQIVYETRELLAELFNITNPTQIAFTANATEAANLGLFGLIKSNDNILTTSMEHNSIARPLRYMQNQGMKVDIIQCNNKGQLNINELAERMQVGTIVVVSHASNVTGSIVELKRLGQIIKEHKGIFIVDAAQSAGVEAIDVQEMAIDMLFFTGHKSLLGPQGTGGIYVNPNLEIKAIKLGGTGSLSESDEQPKFMPDMLESGTLNTMGIAGLKAGISFIKEMGLENIKKHEVKLTEKLITGLMEIKKVNIYGPRLDENRAAVVSFNIEGKDSGEVAFLLENEFEIISRSGLHCAPWAHKTIGTLETGTIRLSPGIFNTDEEIEATIAAIYKLAHRR